MRYFNMRLVIAALALVLLHASALHADESSGKRGTAEEAQAMVAKAIAYFDEVGVAAAMKKINDNPAPEFRKGDLYVFVGVPDGLIVAHGVDQSLLGRDIAPMKDVDGKPFGKEMLSVASSKGAWVDYKWRNPVTGKTEPKSSWVVLHDGHIFGVGIYKP